MDRLARAATFIADTVKESPWLSGVSLAFIVIGSAVLLAQFISEGNPRT